MESLKLPQKIFDFIQKQKYVLIVILVGIVLMFLPIKETAKTETKTIAKSVNTNTTEKQLEEILTRVSGAGRVSVMLTEIRGEETHYQTDIDKSDGQSREDTVILTDAQRTQNGLITQVNPPVYLGAIIVCDGADDPAVRLAIVEAVTKITGLGANNISVLKMN